MPLAMWTDAESAQAWKSVEVVPPRGWLDDVLNEN